MLTYLNGCERWWWSVVTREIRTINCIWCVDNLFWFQFVGSYMLNLLLTARQQLISFATHAHFQLLYFATKTEANDDTAYVSTREMKIYFWESRMILLWNLRVINNALLVRHCFVMNGKTEYFCSCLTVITLSSLEKILLASIVCFEICCYHVIVDSHYVLVTCS